MSDENTLPVVHSAKDLSLSFPEKNKHISDKEAEKSRSLVKNNGAYTNDGRAYIDRFKGSVPLYPYDIVS